MPGAHGLPAGRKWVEQFIWCESQMAAGLHQSRCLTDPISATAPANSPRFLFSGAREDYLLERIDHRFSDRTRSRRYVFDRTTADGQVENLPSQGPRSDAEQYFTLNWDSLLSSNIVNVARHR